MNKIFDIQWQRARAFNSIKQKENGIIDFSDTLLHQLPSGAEIYENIQHIENDYYLLVTKPERESIATEAKSIVKYLPEYFEYVDLGPGTEHKEQFFFDELKSLGKKFLYIPVDFNQEFLNQANAYALKQGITTKPINSTFEDLPSKLQYNGVPKFISIGLTFVNYNCKEIIKLLSEIAGKGGFAFINTHIYDRVDMKKLVKSQEGFIGFYNKKLELVGLDPKNDVKLVAITDEIKLILELLKSNEQLEKIGIKKGDKLCVFQSLRQKKEQLEEKLKETGCSYMLFDGGNSFIPGLIFFK